MKCSRCCHWLDNSGEAGFGKCRAVHRGCAITDQASRGFNPYPAEGGGDQAEDRWQSMRDDALKSAMAYLDGEGMRGIELVTAPDYFCALFTALPGSSSG